MTSYGFAGIFAPERRSGAAERRLASDMTGGRRPVTVGDLAIAGSCGFARSETGGGCRLLAFDGRIDDPDRLSADLGLESVCPESAGPNPGATDDASLVLAAFRQWGGDALPRLRGGFALACWNDTAQQLSLACDPLGQHALFYARVDGRLAFATGLRPLLGFPGVARDLDETYLACFLSDVLPDPEATFYAAIRRVPAACEAVFARDGSMRLREYWRPDWERRIRHRCDETYVEEARALLDRAVRRQLRGLNPVVCHLSGGLDSSGVAATAARLREAAPVHALTAAPADGAPRLEHRNAIADERNLAGAVARLHPNMAWEAISAPGLHPLDEDPVRLFLPLGMPLRAVMNIGWFAPLHERARALGAKAVLCGTMGNLTLSWGGLSGLAGMARRGDWARLWREATALGSEKGMSPWAVLRRYGVKPLLPPRLQAWVDDRRGVARPLTERYSAINPEFARDAAIRERRLEMGDGYPADSTDMRRRWLRQLQWNAVTPGALRETFGVEQRDPTADLDLLEFCFAVPDEQYIRNGTTRWLARRVLADRLPAEVVNETRHGYQCAEFFHRMTLRRDRIVEGVDALARSPLASRVLDVARLKRLTADWPADASGASSNEYRAVLNRGLHYGQFLRWIESGNQ